MKTLENNQNEKINLYEKVAQSLTSLINGGTFRPGARLPSVRQLHQQMKVSITTILEAYHLLEDQGLIEVRPQSGYYVRPVFPPLPSEPNLPLKAEGPVKVNVGELALKILRDMRNPELVPLGASAPNLELLPADKLNQTLAAVTRRQPIRSIAYEPPPGYEALRIQIARRALAAGCVLTPEDIVITSGCREAIMLALKAICRPGDTIALESPSYYSFLQSIEALGLCAVEIPTHPQEGLSLEVLGHVLQQMPIKACLVISNFNNPLGSCMPKERKQELVELLSAHEIPLIEDDIYGDLYFSAERPQAVKAYDQKGLVLWCSSFSKTLAPGYRVGWVAPGRFKSEIKRQKYMNNIATATPMQMALADFLANGRYDHHLRNIRRIYARQVALMAEAVGRYFPEGTKVTRPSGGFVLWVELPTYVDSIQLYQQALQKGITLAPGPIFSTRQKYNNFIRLNAAHWSPRIEQAIAVIGRLAKEMKKHHN